MAKKNGFGLIGGSNKTKSQSSVEKEIEKVHEKKSEIDLAREKKREEIASGEDKKKQKQKQRQQKAEEKRTSKFGVMEKLPIERAMEILGAPRDSFAVLNGESSDTRIPKEFHFSQYGVGIRFRFDEGDGRYVTVNSFSLPNSTAAAYWLIDKLHAETGGNMFYCPGREGIVR